MRLSGLCRTATATLLLVLVSAQGAGTQEPRGQTGTAARESLRRAGAGIDRLQSWYVQSSGLYRTTGWWNSANAITVVVDYSRVSGSSAYFGVLANTFEHAQGTHSGFLNDYYDDEGWWALAWIDAYDLTRNPQYLLMAESIFADMAGGWDATVCGGGIWWSRDRKYKNAIANELFLSVAAHLANRVHDPAQRVEYRAWAEREWKWFRSSGMINSQYLVNDGLISSNPSMCVNNGKTTWSYNQGVILGALVELNRAKHDSKLSNLATAIAGSTLNHLTDGNGILHDRCEPHGGADCVQFKGIFVRNLVVLNDAFPRAEYTSFVQANADSIWSNSRGESDQLGQVWSGPFEVEGAGSHSSALDALVAAAVMSKASRSTHQSSARH